MSRKDLQRHLIGEALCHRFAVARHFGGARGRQGQGKLAEKSLCSRVKKVGSCNTELGFGVAFGIALVALLIELDRMFGQHR